LFREWSEADFPKLLCYIGFGKSYLIPETTNFDIGEGIELCHIIFTLTPIIFDGFKAALDDFKANHSW